MNYKKIYDQLVQSRVHRGTKKEKGFEVHHIVPRCLGGNDSTSNLVKFTFREHYVAHWLLTKIYPHEPKIHYGFLCIIRDPHGQRPLTSRMVANIKSNFSQFKRWHMKTIDNPGKTAQSRQAARDRMNSDRNPMRGRPESNPTARPHRVIFQYGTSKVYQYGKLGYEDIGMSRSSWITAVRTGIPVPKYKVERIEKL